MNKKERNISIICHSVALLTGIVLMVLASFYDLQLSKAVGDQSNFFGQLFAIIGEYPSYFMVPICGTIFFYNFDRVDNKNTQLFIKIGGAVVVFIGILMFGLMGTKLKQLEHNTLWSVFNAFFFGTLFLIIGNLVPKDTMHRLLKFAVFALTFVLVALLVMRVMKVIWCRMRYRDMLKEGNFDGFSNWWVPMFGREKLDPSYHYTSFPSGHSSSIVHLFLICVLCDILPSWKSKKWLKPTLYGVFVVIVILCTFSRIINCAHFLSDVVAGTFITYGIFYLLKWLFFKNGKYEYEMKCSKELEKTDVEEEKD